MKSRANAKKEQRYIHLMSHIKPFHPEFKSETIVGASHQQATKLDLEHAG